MGGANNICSDKTGTLTKNLMTVTNIFVEEQSTDIIDREIMKENSCKLLCLSVCNNSNANPVITQSGGNININQIGNKTECALLEMAFRMGYDYKRVRNRDYIKKIFPFSSEKKKMCTVYREERGSTYCFVKGAPDFLLPYCTKYINKTGHVTKITPAFSESMQENILDFANKSLRTILLAYKEVNEVP
jgi:Ca2+ transporting ATPase